MKKVNLESYVQSVIQKNLVTYHVVVRQHGEVVGKFDWRDNRPDSIMSCTKSIDSMAIGIALDEGIISLNDKPSEIFPEKLPANPSPYLLDITVRDMIMMATGHDYFILQGYSVAGDAPGRGDLTNSDWIKYAFSFDVPFKPGTYWKYNNFGPYLTSCIIQKRTGQRLVDYLKPRFFYPLGITNPQWEEDPEGRTLGTGNLMMSCDEMSRCGQVFLDGTFEGKRLVGQSWVKEATSKQIDNTIKGKVQTPDENAGYGYFFWRNARDNSYSARGWGGQFIIMLPEQDAVVSIVSHDFESQKFLDSVWEHIVPQLKENA